LTLKKQLAVLIGLLSGFVLFDLALYNIFTSRYVDSRSEEMKGRSIEVSQYLPFTEDSGIVHIDTDVMLSGDLPVLDGAAALYPIFSSVADAVYPVDSVSFDGNDFTEDSALQFHNTRGAYKAVVDGDADIVFCAGPSQEQLAYAEEKGVELVMVPIGYEAFVFIVGKDNPVDDLTVEQVKGIYSGQYTRWSEVGGDDSFIDAVQRNKGSGSQTTMLSFMGGTPIRRNIPGILFGRAIGFSFRYYVDGINGNDEVKMLALNGVYPDKENIASGAYLLSSSFYAVYAADNDNPNISALLDFILSDEGQRIVEGSGYVPLR